MLYLISYDVLDGALESERTLNYRQLRRKLTDLGVFDSVWMGI